ncbi:MAG: hypothetical protein ABSE16_01620 [Verrucomicrobiota bacterium]|jgi:hypothetical protein
MKIKVSIVAGAGLLLAGICALAGHFCGSHAIQLCAQLCVAGSLPLLLLADATPPAATPPAPATAVPVVPKNSKDLEGIRGFFTTLKSQFASAATVYEGPIRQLFDEVTAKLEAALAALPKTADANWSLAEQLDSFFSLLACANNCASTLNLELSKLKQQMAGIGPAALEEAVRTGVVMRKADFETAVAAEMTKRTTSGALVPKATVDQLCSAAKVAGISEGRTQVEQEQAAKLLAEKTAGERKAALTTAGLPLPDADAEAILRASEAEFDSAKATAEKRVKTLAGLSLTAELLAAVWRDEKTYGVFEKTVNGIAALKHATPSPEPFATPPGAANQSGKKMIV